VKQSYSCTICSNNQVDWGYAYLGGLTSFNGTTGWHNYTSGNVQSYLNGLTSALSFTITSDASLYSGTAATNRLPSGDSGYYLSTDDATNTPGITISAKSVSNSAQGFSNVAFYWGSIDPWNQIGFCYSNGTCDYVYGSQLSGFKTGYWSSSNPNLNINSAVVDFQPSSTGSPWAYMTFTSCDNQKQVNCYPSFEIDNLEYLTTACPCGPIAAGAPTAAVPEPTSALLLLGSAAVALKRLRRKV